jgi:uncharacterized membrane protein YgcG
MIKVRNLRSLVGLAVLAVLSLLSHSDIAASSDVERAIEAGMRAALSGVGLGGADTERIARQYLFIGSVMIKNVSVSSLEEEEEFLRQSEEVGRALGTALGITSTLYGDNRLEETATVMMHSVRAGVSAEVASNTYSVLATSGYAFEAATSLLHEVSEAVRNMRSDDGGASVCGGIQARAIKNETLGSLRREITLAIDREREKQIAILAKNDMERRKHNGSDNGDKTASSQGGGTGSSGENTSGGGDVGKAGGESSSGGSSGQ